MRFLGSVGFTLIAAAALISAPVPKAKEKIKDEDAILGTWKVITVDTAGGPCDQVAAILAKVTFTFEKKNVLILTGIPFNDENEPGTYKIDPDSKMKTIDVTVTLGKTILGIYELDGDTIKLCWADDPKESRPEEFKADKQHEMALITLKRVKPDTKDEKKDK